MPKKPVSDALSLENPIMIQAKAIVGRVMKCSAPDDEAVDRVINDDSDVQLAMFLAQTLESAIERHAAKKQKAKAEAEAEARAKAEAEAKAVAERASKDAADEAAKALVLAALRAKPFERYSNSGYDFEPRRSADPSLEASTSRTVYDYGASAEREFPAHLKRQFDKYGSLPNLGDEPATTSYESTTTSYESTSYETTLRSQAEEMDSMYEPLFTRKTQVVPRYDYEGYRY